MLSVPPGDQCADGPAGRRSPSRRAAHDIVTAAMTTTRGPVPYASREQPARRDGSHHQSRVRPRLADTTSASVGAEWRRDLAARGRRRAPPATAPLGETARRSPTAGDGERRPAAGEPVCGSAACSVRRSGTSLRRREHEGLRPRTMSAATVSPTSTILVTNQPLLPTRRRTANPCLARGTEYLPHGSVVGVGSVNVLKLTNATLIAVLRGPPMSPGTMGHMRFFDGPDTVRRAREVSRRQRLHARCPHGATRAPRVRAPRARRTGSAGSSDSGGRSARHPAAPVRPRFAGRTRRCSSGAGPALRRAMDLRRGAHRRRRRREESDRHPAAGRAGELVGGP